MTEYRDNIFILGASGHGKVVADIVENENRYAIECFVDDDVRLRGQKFFDYNVVGTRSDYEKSGKCSRGLIAIGDNKIRCSLATELEASGYTFVSVIHPSAVCGKGVSLERGTVLMAGVVINADSEIGAHCIVNTRCSVDHDCSIARCVHLAPGVTLCGAVCVGERTLIGAGTTILPNVSIGKDVIVGAGSTIVDDIPDGIIAVGNRKLRVKINEQ